MRHARRLTRLALHLAMLVSASCATLPDLRLAPAVQDTELRGEAGDTQAHLVLAWRGVHERDDEVELRFRVRVENPGTTLFTLVPADFVLLDGALAEFGAARIETLPVAVAPGDSATFDLAFPARGSRGLETFELTALTLRTRFQGGRWSWSTTFQRVEWDPYRHDPFWDARWHGHVGVVWCRP